MKRFLLFLAGILLIAGTLSTPIQVKADGGPRPQCMPGETCKP